MQDARLQELHTSLSSAQEVRGAHGGLGFDGAAAKKSGSGKEKKTKAEKSLMQSSTSSGREYSTTTAGAVAMGHWDPFARPIEFKMKEVNRKVGTLYSMFVKGGVEGNTLKEKAAPPEPPAKSSSATAASPSTAPDTFNWKRAIKEALRAAPGSELKLKKLRKAVLKEFTKQHAKGDKAEARRLFKKRLKKMDAVSIDKKHVRLKA